MSYCSACGHENRSGARFCNECGTAVDQEPGPLAAGYSQLAAGVRDRLAPSVRGEHRLVTCLFADLVGSVSRMQDMAPESATRFVNSLLQLMVEVLVRYGGTIDRFLGDGLLAVFGVPQAHENDPERAVRAALEIQAQAAQLDLSVTVGVNSGRVYFGPVGSSLHEELTVMGPVVNLAARLQSSAEAGQVLIGEATNDQVHRAFATTAVDLDIKGIAQPVTAYLAERLLDQPEKVRGIGGLQSKLIGRDRELADLTSLFGKPGGHLRLIRGGAGVGKSRLASELRHHVGSHNGIWLEGRCAELTQEVGYAALRDVLHREHSSEQSLMAEMDKMVAHSLLHPEWVDEVAPFLLALVSEEPGPVVAASSEQERRALTLEAFRGYMQARAAAGPLALMVDDLHWSDPLTLDLLANLVQTPCEEAILFLVLSRPDSDLESTAGYQALVVGSWSSSTIPLRELTETESRELINSLLQIDGLPSGLEETIVARAEGNPFFVEEIVRSFIQRGVVFRDGSTWSASPGLVDIEIPENVQAIVASRLDRLPDETRFTAQNASVLDRSFRLEILDQMAGPGLVQYLQNLVDAGLLVPEGGVSPTDYSFRHALTRDAIYETLLPSQRMELHERAGEAYETISPDQIEQLAHHFERSANHEKAVRYLIGAARQSMNSFLNAAALDYVDTATERLSELAPSRAVDEQAQIHGVRGELSERLARHEEAQIELRLALEIGVSDPLLEIRLWTVLGRSLRLQGDFELAHEAYDAAQALIANSAQRQTTEYQRAAIDIGKDRSWALYFGGSEEELSAHNAALAPVVAAHGTVGHRMDHLIGEALSQFRENRYKLGDETVSLVEPIVGLARQSRNPGRMAEASFLSGFAMLWADRIDEATSHLGEAVRLSDRVGDATLLMRATAYHAVALRRAGASGVQAAAERALDLATAASERYYIGHAQATLAWAAWARGEIEPALALADAAYSAWGRGTVDPDQVDSNFAWMAVWPAAASEFALDRLESIGEHLSHLQSPHERPMNEHLQSAVATVLDAPEPGSVERMLGLAKKAKLL
jgi:class 3 adenylate cyclase/tetratricopeptide (TPR) repeat protein